MKREKIGTRYYRSGYGKNRPRSANIYLIDGFAYAKDKATAEISFCPCTGELEGYVTVNGYRNTLTGKMDFFAQMSANVDKHLPFETQAQQAERLTHADKMLKALAENLPEVEMPKESFERVWMGIEKHLEGAECKRS